MPHAITLEEIEKDVETLEKKIFIYQTLQSKREVEEGKVRGPFKTVKQLLKQVKGA